MISERQAREMLVYCEDRLSRQLVELRHRLQSAEPHSALWELIILDSVLHQGPAQHEPHEGAPDIFVGDIDTDRLFLELAWITPSAAKCDESVRQFIRWLRRQIRQVRGDVRIDLQVEVIDNSKPAAAPPEKQWAEVTHGDSWLSFARSVPGSVDAAYQIQCANLRIILEQIGAGDSESTYMPVLNLPDHPEDHPIYRTIRRKARQAHEWRKQSGTYQPLVLVIGADEGLSHIDPMGCGSVTLKQAVYSALLDEKTQHPITRYNFAGSWPAHDRKSKQGRSRSGQGPSWSMVGPRIRVSHSSLISGVAITLLRDEFDVGSRRIQRRARLTFYPNPDAETPLTEDDELLVLNCLQLERVEFTSRSECWEYDPEKGESLSQVRSRRRGGSISVSKGHGSVLQSIEIPAVLLHRILAGDITAAEAWQDYSLEIHSDLHRALQSGQEISAVQFISPTQGSGEEPRVRLTFDSTRPTIRVPKQRREG